MIAQQMNSRGIRGRLIMPDPNPLPRRVRRLLEER